MDSRPCIHCGNEHDSRTRFCPRTGKALDAGGMPTRASGSGRSTRLMFLPTDLPLPGGKPRPKSPTPFSTMAPASEPVEPPAAGSKTASASGFIETPADFNATLAYGVAPLAAAAARPRPPEPSRTSTPTSVFLPVHAKTIVPAPSAEKNPARSSSGEPRPFRSPLSADDLAFAPTAELPVLRLDASGNAVPPVTVAVAVAVAAPDAATPAPPSRHDAVNAVDDMATVAQPILTGWDEPAASALAASGEGAQTTAVESVVPAVRPSILGPGAYDTASDADSLPAINEPIGGDEAIGEGIAGDEPWVPSPALSEPEGTANETDADAPEASTASAKPKGRAKPRGKRSRAEVARPETETETDRGASDASGLAGNTEITGAPGDLPLAPSAPAPAHPASISMFEALAGKTEIVVAAPVAERQAVTSVSVDEESAAAAADTTPPASSTDDEIPAPGSQEVASAAESEVSDVAAEPRNLASFHGETAANPLPIATRTEVDHEAAAKAERADGEARALDAQTIDRLARLSERDDGTTAERAALAFLLGFGGDAKSGSELADSDRAVAGSAPAGAGGDPDAGGLAAHARSLTEVASAGTFRSEGREISDAGETSGTSEVSSGRSAEGASAEGASTAIAGGSASTPAAGVPSDPLPETSSQRATAAGVLTDYHPVITSSRSLPGTMTDAHPIIESERSVILEGFTDAHPIIASERAMPDPANQVPLDSTSLGLGSQSFLSARATPASPAPARQPLEERPASIVNAITLPQARLTPRAAARIAEAPFDRPRATPQSFVGGPVVGPPVGHVPTPVGSPASRLPTPIAASPVGFSAFSSSSAPELPAHGDSGATRARPRSAPSWAQPANADDLRRRSAGFVAFDGPLTFKRLLVKTARFYAANLLPLLAITALVLGPACLLTSAMMAAVNAKGTAQLGVKYFLVFMTHLLVMGLAWPLTSGVVSRAVLIRLQGGRIHPLQQWTAALLRALPLASALVPASIMIALGFHLFFVPGLVAALLLAVAPTVVFMEGKEGFAALVRSTNLINEVLRRAVGGLALFLVLALLVYKLVGLLPGESTLELLLWDVAFVALAPLPMIALTLLYLDHRLHAEGLDEDRLRIELEAS